MNEQLFDKAALSLATQVTTLTPRPKGYGKEGDTEGIQEKLATPLSSDAEGVGVYELRDRVADIPLLGEP